MGNRNLIKIMEYKIANPNAHAYRNIRYNGEKEYDNILDEIKTNQFLSSAMKKEYFPNTLEKVCQTEIAYNASEDGSINNLLIWGSYLLENYANEINKYLRYKEYYERELFNGNYKTALKWIHTIEKEVSVSLWGKQQEFLVLNLQSETCKVDSILDSVEQYISSNMTVLLMHFYGKMTNRQVTYENYMNMVNDMLSGADSTNAVWKYFDYKLSIGKEKGIHGIKIALAIDEQISIVDYYETYIDSLVLLSSKEKNRCLIAYILKKIYGKIGDNRIKCLHVAFVDSEDIILDEDVCEIVEEYTRGNYKQLKELWQQKRKKINQDYTICNLFVKAGVDIAKDVGFMSDFWQEIQKMYGLEYEINISTQKICEYYKILYNTSWRYKIQGVLTRKLKLDFGENVLNWSILNDKYFTPIFHQCIFTQDEKLKYISRFAKYTPATYQLHLYLITGNANSMSLDEVEKNRRAYYGVKYCFEQAEYKECISSINLIKQDNTLSNYEKERVDKILFECYLKTNEYVNAMHLYIENYLFNKVQIARMNILLLVDVIEETDNEEIKANICRSIILALYYEGKSEDIISSYLDYLECNDCNTIIDFLEKNPVLDEYHTLFLDKVCTINLLLKDYISKTVTNGSAVELRVQILKKLIADGSGDIQRFINELNTIYKEQQLKTRIDSFNHNRIFIDRENLIAYLQEEITREFARFNVVQEIRSLTKGNKVGFANKEFLMENYWDRTKFFTEIIEKIKAAYLSESPYSLESFLSTRIRHNFCNDKLKKVFEEQNLFSKKETDASQEYNVNVYWQNKMSSLQYELLKPELSKFSREIDVKIQEIKADWIRIKKGEHNEGMFDYLDFTYNFMNYVVWDFEIMLSNPVEFLRGVIKALDIYTEQILKQIRDRIVKEIRPYYYDRIIALENGIKRLEIAQNIKAELLRRIEISKAKYIEDIDSFQDIFNMDNEKYLNYGFDELIEFCIKIESDMNRDFSNAHLSIDNKCTNNYKGSTFPYLVDIMEILLRNAVQHSEITDMKQLNIDISISKASESELPKVLKEAVDEYVNAEGAIVINMCNNLDESVNAEENYNKMQDIIDNIINKNYRTYINKEGGSGLYKIARTIDYNLDTRAAIYGNNKECFFDVFLIIDLDKYEVKE